MNPTAELSEVSVRSGAVPRLRDVTLSIQPGSITAVIGANGSGKSTLLSVLAAELRPTTGTVMLGNDDASRLSASELARRRALLSQDSMVNFGFTVRDVVSWGRTAWRGTDDAKHDEAIVNEVMSNQGITLLADRSVAELSGGERKRVHIARVLCQQAPLVLLDEADSDLDLAGRLQLDAVMSSLSSAGTSVVVVSHDIARVSSIATRIIALRAGEVACDGVPFDVLRSETLSHVFDTKVHVERGDRGYLIIATS